MKTKTVIFFGVAFIACVMLLNDFTCTVWGYTIASAICIVWIVGIGLCRTAKRN